MIVEQIRTLRRQMPFYPFKIHLRDRRVFDVPMELRLSIAPSNRFVYVCARTGLVRIDVNDIERVEVASEPIPEDYVEPLDDAPGERAA